MFIPFGRRCALAVTALVVVVSPASCAAGPRASSDTQTGDIPAAASPLDGMTTSHVHSIAVNPADHVLLAATHEGLFELRASGQVRVGPVIDLMGFDVVGPDHFRASGHPGEGTDLSNPVGLIESVDGGQTWATLSREGVSDFHALAAWDDGVLGLGDGLERSDDLTTWQQLKGPEGVFDLATADGRTVLATTPDGLQRSEDAGTAWQPVPDAPLLAYVEFIDPARAFGVAPDGAVATTDDAGRTWTQQGSAGQPPLALAAIAGDEGPHIVVLTAQGLRSSSDGGRSFGDWTPIR